MKVLFGMQGPVARQNGLSKTQTNRLNALADTARWISDEELCSGETNPEQSRPSAKRRKTHGQSNHLAPDNREAALRQSSAQGISGRLQSVLGLLKAISEIPNRAARVQTLSTLFSAEKSTPVVASDLDLAALVGNATDIKTKLDHPLYSVEAPDDLLKTISAAYNAKKLGYSEVVKAIGEHPKVVSALAKVNQER